VPLPLLVDLALAAFAGLAALLAAAWVARAHAPPGDIALEPARAAGEAIRPHGPIRALVARCADRSVATGLLLTIALAITLAAGVLLGVLAYLSRSFPALRHLDKSVAAWGYDHRTPFSTAGLRAITDIGTGIPVIALALVVVAVDLARTRRLWAAPFVVAVLGGVELVTLGVKDLVDRARPAFVPQAASLGPSFPSGHSSTSAAFYAAAALILTRYAGSRARRVAGMAAVAIAVAVAGSRVLLDLHWLSDVVGGLALGWGWFTLCAAVFGGRLLRPTAAVETAKRSAAPPRRQAGAPRAVN